MSERVIISTAEEPGYGVCADNSGEWFVLSSFVAGNEDAQITLPAAAARRLGEWLVERANQAGERA